jgi:putative phosphoribosyl transferase
MTFFLDRQDAGRQLAKALKEYADAKETLVIALPRGGVVVGYEVAQALHLPLDIVCPRKIGAPFNPELAIGAITETGEAILSQDLVQSFRIPESYLKEAMEREKKEAALRLKNYRKKRSSRQLKGKRIILVDDGLATGSTMRAAIKTIRAEEAKELIMAIPVSPPDTLQRLKSEVDRTICLHAPSAFYAVGQFYESFGQTSDEEVISLLNSQ